MGGLGSISLHVMGSLTMTTVGLLSYQMIARAEEMKMKGFLGIFFTQQNRRYFEKMRGDWIVSLAKDMGLRGATLSTGIAGCKERVFANVCRQAKCAVNCL